MNSRDAKEILMLYRPGTADAQDSSFAEALRLCESDPELKGWFDQHCAGYLALRSRFKQIAVPEGLKEQILAERQLHVPAPPRRPALLAAAAAVLILLAAIGIFWLRPSHDADFGRYETRMFSTAMRTYSMELETNSLTSIQQFLADNRAVADYNVPAALEQNATATGCVALTWQGKAVSMICFHSGQPLQPGEKSDLFLFVTDTTSVPGAPTDSTPAIDRVNRATTAAWTQGGKTYMLIAAGNEEFIRRYL